MPITDDGTKPDENEEDMGTWGPAAWQQMKDDIDWLKSLVVPAVTKREDRGPPWIIIMTGCLTPIIVALIATAPWK